MRIGKKIPEGRECLVFGGRGFGVRQRFSHWRTGLKRDEGGGECKSERVSEPEGERGALEHTSAQLLQT
jgi:hypothetical protein